MVQVILLFMRSPPMGKSPWAYADSDIESPNYTNKPVLSKRAIVWSGDNWATKTDLGTLRSDNLGQANANAISADGKIIGGQSYSDIIGTNYNSNLINDSPNNNLSYRDNTAAIIWSGDNWATKTNLGTLATGNYGPSAVTALSADGTIAGGRAVNNSFITRAIIWSGYQWATKTDLGTLKSDNSGDPRYQPSPLMALSP